MSDQARLNCGTGLMLVIFLLFLGGIISQCSGGGQQYQSPAQIQAQEGSWRLDRFENEVIEFEGRLWDKGWFTNLQTGEVLEARCLNPEAADPDLGDLFVLSDGRLIPTKDGPQTFEPLFQVLPTPTIVPTSTPFPTFVPPAAEVEPIRPSAPREEFDPWENPLATLGGLLCLVIIAFVGSFLLFVWGKSRGG